MALHGLDDLGWFEVTAIFVVLLLSLAALGYAYWLRNQILAYETGTDRMREVWGWIRAGARAYLFRQFRTIAVAIFLLSVLLYLSVRIIPPSREAMAVWGDRAPFAIAVGRTIAFL